MSNLCLPLSLYGLRIVSREPVEAVLANETASQKEVRSTWSTYPRTRYRLAVDVVRSDTRLDFQQLVRFFQMHRGPLSNFLIVDPEDCAVTNHGFGVGDGSTTVFQLQRTLLGAGVYDLTNSPGAASGIAPAGAWAPSSAPRTNLCLQSEAFDNASWTKTSASATANAAVAPDGNKTGEKLVEAAATAQHLAQQAVTLVSGKAFTFSVWAKAAERSQCALVSADTGTPTAIFDLSAGSVVSTSGGATAAIVSAHNGWWRCSITYTAATSLSTQHSVMLASGGATSYAGDGTSGAYFWGAQIEQASAATQYIATTTAAVTSSPAYWPATGDGFEPCTDVADGPTIAVAGTTKVQGTDYTVAFNTGTLPTLNGSITFSVAPASGAALTWTGSYFRRVRFANPSLPLERIVPSMWSSSGLELLSDK